VGEARGFDGERDEIRQRIRQEQIGERIDAEVEQRQVCELGRKGKIRELVDLEIERNQIASRLQPEDAAHVSTTGVKVGQAQEVLLRQRAGGFLQALADGRIQAGIGNGYFLRLGQTNQHR
jgi:hypothetical protein